MKPIVCLILLAPLAAIADDAVLKMHVFDVEKTEAGAHKNKSLNMIIFDEQTGESSQVSAGSNRQKIKPTNVKHRYWSAALQTGYKRDSFQWQTASPAGGISPFAEAKWDKLDLWQIQADLGFKLPMGFVAKGHAAYAFTFSGKTQENGYIQNNSDPFIQSNGSADSGYSADFSGAIGYQFDWGDQVENDLSGYLTPLVGFAFQEQKYTMRGGVQTVGGGDSTPANLNNDYLAGWAGPWLGFDAGMNLFERHGIFTSFEHHWADYRGLGDWQENHLEHHAQAHGYKTQLGYQYKPNATWAFSFAFAYEYWNTGSGTESLTLSNQAVVKSQFNSAVRESFGVNAGVNVAF